MRVPTRLRENSGGWIRTNDLRVMSGTSSVFTFSCPSTIYDFSAFRAGQLFGQHVEHVQHVERKFSCILAAFRDAMQMQNSRICVAGFVGFLVRGIGAHEDSSLHRMCLYAFINFLVYPPAFIPVIRRLGRLELDSLTL